MTDDLTLPAFLRRHDGPSASGPAARPADGARDWYMPEPSERISPAVRDRIAGDVTAAVERGADTFGKLRRMLGQRYSDRELRAGIRAARHWRTRLRPGTSGGRPVMRRTRVVLVLIGRRYSVLEA